MKQISIYIQFLCIRKNVNLHKHAQPNYYYELSKHFINKII